jgi:hypothetical protein
VRFNFVFHRANIRFYPFMGLLQQNLPKNKKHGQAAKVALPKVLSLIYLSVNFIYFTSFPGKYSGRFSTKKIISLCFNKLIIHFNHLIK